MRPPQLVATGGHTFRPIWRVAALLLLDFVMGASYAQDFNLEQRGDYVVGYQYRNGQGKRLPPGWTGSFDSDSGVSYRPVGKYLGKAASLLHCPWRGGTGIAFQEFTIRLPVATAIRLKGATAMQAGTTRKSDGATFRVFINGRQQLSRHQTAVDWDGFDIDLFSYSGQPVVLRFETDPGQADNPDFDFSLWGDRRIEVAGATASAAVAPAMPTLDLSKLKSQARESVVPWVVRTAEGRWTQVTPGGVFNYRDEGSLFALSVSGKFDIDSPFPVISVIQGHTAGAAQTLVIPQAAILRWARPVRAGAARQEIEANSLVARRVFVDQQGETATVRTTLRVLNQSLVLEVSSDKAWLSEVSTSGWQPEAERVLVPTPYYSGQIALLPRLDWFANSFFDWRSSSASSLAGGVATYASLTNGHRNMMRERIVYAFSTRLEEVFPHVPNPPSPFRADVAGRVFLDSWGGTFASIEKQLAELTSSGLSDCVLTVHDWQRSGYDNALPAHVPAAASNGGEAGLRSLVSAGQRAGCRVAVHENYADIYPNFEGFSLDDVALASDGQPLKAWFNSGTRIQSFAMRPNAMLNHAGSQATEIVKRYGTDAAFLDVHSSMPPWFHVDFRSSESGAGQFRQVFDQTAQLWLKQRQWHHGPVFGEGADHWYWSGLLDGVEAQPGAGWEMGEGDYVPLAVGFSVLKLNPLQIDHGMGYYHRWSSKVDGGAKPTDALLDRYRLQEIAFGHAAYLGNSTWHTTWDLWLEQHLVPPVIRRSAQSPVSVIEHWNGTDWVSMSEAARAGTWDAVRVVYTNGLVVMANAGLTDVIVDGEKLPPNSWRARGQDFESWSIRGSAERQDYSADSDHVFANVLSRHASKNVPNEGVVAPFKRMVRFPGLSTDGSVSIQRQNGKWLMLTAPDSPAMTVALDNQIFGNPTELNCVGVTPAPIQTDDRTQLSWALNIVGGTNCSWTAIKPAVRVAPP